MMSSTLSGGLCNVYLLIVMFFSVSPLFVSFLATSALGADKFAKFNQPAALSAYKDINDAAASDPVVVLGRTWKKFVYPDDYELPKKPSLGAYQDVINSVKDPKTVLGTKTFETKCKYSTIQRPIHADCVII
ncbi:hypothetical protein FKW77_001255 [Venturia effusa]|uniref:Uncharacterized protein n=1 Tax=Venturia effusa TaxID=50376 RepID=A0A517LI26_9PEZI|nr:hypothetical protein FKW77_001255 [Venturia effusa]